MDVVLSGILKHESDEQYWNAWLPMVVTLDGIVMLERELQPANA